MARGLFFHSVDYTGIIPHNTQRSIFRHSGSHLIPFRSVEYTKPFSPVQGHHAVGQWAVDPLLVSLY